MKQYALGPYIRQLRKEQHLTQTELGGGRYSKSYVSALERGVLTPSHQALQFFAAQLHLSDDIFAQLWQHTQEGSRLPATQEQKERIQEYEHRQEVTMLLDMVVSEIPLHAAPLEYDFLAMPDETLKQFPLWKQAQYSFLKGMQAQRKGDLAAAVTALEYALALAPAKHQIAILDALGITYARAQMYQTALSYHRRALNLVQQEQNSERVIDLLLLVAVHCGDDYQMLTAHKAAREHYQYARQFLSATHDIEIAGRLYLGLGYSTYAALVQEAPPATIFKPESIDEHHRAFKQAISFLLQSRMLYQASHNRPGETRARLQQALVLIEYSIWQQRIAHEKANPAQLPPPSTTLLNDATEQCHQVFLLWQETQMNQPEDSREGEPYLYTALSYLIRIHVQQARMARLGQYDATAIRERALASFICQQVLDNASGQDFPWWLLQEITSLTTKQLTPNDQSLPPMPATSHSATGSNLAQHPLSQTEIYLASSEVAEELGRAAISPDYRDECYTRADAYFLAALQRASQGIPGKEHDGSSLIRWYRRYIYLVEERFQAASDLTDRMVPVLLTLLKEEISLLRERLLRREAEAEFPF